RCLYDTAPGPRPRRDGSDPADPVRILSVGRAVEKKGHDHLLEALARLPADLAWRLEHIGGGPLLPALRRQAAALGIGGRITWRGPQPQDAVLEAYRRADLFALASRIAGDGDRDGLPNVLMEAQSQGLAVVATRVSAIPELVEDGANGLLVAPGDVRGLAAALQALVTDPERRAKLGAAGERRVRGRFDMNAGIDVLAERLGGTEAARPPRPRPRERAAG
ncbi:MAG: glycosyltransferase family 4 protein, partial [Rhodospirillaceae bacterium]|nr:glycosyltransferase family 4 protein [Rhodospirillaceae bacterium]